MNEMLSASSVLECLHPGVDVIVKQSSNLPRVANGADIDIYSNDSSSLVKRLIDSHEGIGAHRLEIRQANDSQIHVDLWFSSQSFFKVDIYAAFPDFSRFEVVDGVFDELIRNHVTVSRNGASYPVLSKEEEAFVRYLEFLEYFWIGPEKPHHFNWILAELSTDELNNLFENCHRRLRPRSGGIKPRVHRARSVTFLQKLSGNISYRYPRVSKLSKTLLLRLPFIGAYLRRELKL